MFFLSELHIALHGARNFLQETLHSHVGNGEVCNDSVALGTAAFESNSPRKSLLKNWPLISSIIVYCVFQLHDMAYAEVIFTNNTKLVHLEHISLLEIFLF